MSKTRKIRRARKARDRAAAELKVKNQQLYDAKSDIKKARGAFDKLFKEWQYHVSFMKQVSPERHSAVFKAEQKPGGINDCMDEQGFHMLRNTRLSPRISTTPRLRTVKDHLLEMRNIRLSVKKDYNEWHNRLSYYVHLRYSHGEEEVYAYSTEMESLLQNPELRAYIINDLLEAVTEKFCERA